MVLAARGLTAQAGMGVMYELDAIAMAVIGGVSLSGGRGSIVGAMLGMVIFGVIISGFTFLRIDAYYQEMIKGVIIVVAVVADVYRQRFRRAADASVIGGAEWPARNGSCCETEGLTKHYGGVHALEDADFELLEGEHVAIVGDNGAGKSTFVRQITGVEQPTAGKIFFDGQEVSFRGPLDARTVGIEAVFQNLALADDLDVPSNIFLGREEILFNLGPFSFLNERKMMTKARGRAGTDRRQDSRPSKQHRATCRAASGSASPSAAPPASRRSSSSWTSRPPRSASRRPRRSKTSSAT